MLKILASKRFFHQTLPGFLLLLPEKKTKKVPKDQIFHHGQRVSKFKISFLIFITKSAILPNRQFLSRYTRKSGYILVT